MTKILFICHGNICRSVMAQCVFQDLINRRHRADAYFVDSAATSREELGSSIYPPAERMLVKKGVPVLAHVSRQITAKDYEKFDYLIGMDEENRRSMLRIFANDPEGKCFLLPQFAGTSRTIADPWYSGDFEAAYRDVLEGCTALFEKLEEEK